MTRLTPLTVAAMLLGIAGLPAAAPCAASDSRCTCVTGLRSLDDFARRFARAEMDTTPFKAGLFLEATLQRIVDVDPAGHPLPNRLDSLRDARTAYDFSVQRVWRRSGSVPVPDTVRFYTAKTSPCPLPAWAKGKTYLIFAYPVADTLRALTPCAMIFPVNFVQGQETITLLDSAFSRR